MLKTAVLVTGATGFVGRQAVAALRRRGVTVHVGTSGDDLLDPDARRRVVEGSGASHLLHLAWTTEHGRFWNDPRNLDWAVASLDLARLFAANGGTRLVFGGSCAEYDWTVAEMPLDELASVRRPATLYGSAKLATGDLLEAWGKAVGVSVARGLLFFMYGPGEHLGRLVPSVISSLLAGERVATTDGTQIRDFLHVEDVGEALTALLLSDVAGTVNIASGIGHRVADVVALLAELVGRPELLDVGSLPHPTDDPPRIVGRTTILDGRVGRPVPRDLRVGLAETVAWWREQKR